MGCTHASVLGGGDAEWAGTAMRARGRQKVWQHDRWRGNGDQMRLVREDLDGLDTRSDRRESGTAGRRGVALAGIVSASPTRIPPYPRAFHRKGYARDFYRAAS